MKKNKFYESCWNCANHIDLFKQPDGAPDYNTNEIRQEFVSRHFCNAKNIALDSGEVAIANSRRALVLERIGEKTRLNDPESMDDVPFEQRNFDCKNSYSAGYTYGEDIGKTVDTGWAQARQGCNDYKSIAQGEKDAAAHEYALELKKFMRKKAAAPAKKKTVLVWDAATKKIIEKEV